MLSRVIENISYYNLNNGDCSEDWWGKRWHSGRDSCPYIMPISNLLEVMGSIP